MTRKVEIIRVRLFKTFGSVERKISKQTDVARKTSTIFGKVCGQNQWKLLVVLYGYHLFGYLLSRAIYSDKTNSGSLNADAI